ncbi:MAG: glycosyltransferase family 9 protein, partial [Alphaproteobacteria bacterium]|nr:glycosyltransferase family 9 protein [Alphaproteobacteria bacterium]
AVFGAPAERADMAPVLAAVPPARLIDYVGTLDLLTVSAALRRAALFVGNDSGLMHIAAASGVPTLGLFGPSRTEWYAPWGAHAAAVRTPQSFAELGGATGFAAVGDRSLMDGLALEAVERAAHDLLRRCRDRAA